MSDSGVQSAVETTPHLSQWQRIVNIFSAPSKTFEDIKRGNRSWWAPFILIVAFSYVLFAGVTMKVGWSQVAENVMRASPKQAERIDQLPPDQRERAMKMTATITEISAAAGPVFAIIGALLVALLLWGTINFGFGGKATFAEVLAVYFYASLPLIVQPLLGAIALFAGLAPESFNINNFAGTNVAYFLSFEETPKALYALCMQFDIVNIWVSVLLAMGIARVAGKKNSAGYITVFGWWAIWALLRVAGGLIMG